jgi:hypothetical protein
MIFVFIGELTNWPNKMFPETRKICKYGVSQKWRTNYLLSYRGSLNVHEKNVSDKKSIIFIIIIHGNNVNKDIFVHNYLEMLS